MSSSRHPRLLAELLRRNTNDLAVQVALAGGAAAVTATGTTEIVYADLEIILDGAGLVIGSGIKMDIPIDFGCTVMSWSMFVDVAATARLDIWRSTYAAFPPVVGGSLPGIAANRPQTVAAVKGSGTALGWTTGIAAGDVLRVNLDTNDAAKRITVALKLAKL